MSIKTRLLHASGLTLIDCLVNLKAHDFAEGVFGELGFSDFKHTDFLVCNGISVEEICKKVRKDVETFVGDADQFDDITMLSIRLNQCVEE